MIELNTTSSSVIFSDNVFYTKMYFNYTKYIPIVFQLQNTNYFCQKPQDTTLLTAEQVVWAPDVWAPALMREELEFYRHLSLFHQSRLNLVMKMTSLSTCIPRVNVCSNDTCHYFINPV